MTCRRCGESMLLADILDHLRLFHPDDYEPGMERWPVEVRA